MRIALQLLFTLLLAGCASLPDVPPLMRNASVARTPSVTGSRGPLTRAQAQAVIARLQARGGGADVLEAHLALEEEIAGAPLTAGNVVELLYDGPATYKSMFDAIARARDHINLEFYIVEGDEEGQRFSDLLIRKRTEGVAVTFIYDSVGSIKTPPEFFKRLRDAGVKVLEYNPANPLQAKTGWSLNKRDHRKILVVDGTVAFLGGINISSVYSSGSTPGSRGVGSAPSSGARSAREGSAKDGSTGWRDTNVRIEGPAVAEVQRLFLETWRQQKGEALEQRNWFPPMKPAGNQLVRIIASGPDDDVPAIYVTLVSAITSAEKSVHITMAYFIPDPQTLAALKDAAARGVDVKLILPSYSDFWVVFHAGRSFYAELLEAGVKIYERQSALLHAKTAIVDGVWSTVGSSNMDWRSYLHNAEINCVVLGVEFGGQMEAMFERDLRESRAIDIASWNRRPLGVRFREWSARAWEYWL
jgi:cardiolipin synthase